MQAESHSLLGSCIAGKYLVEDVVEETGLSIIYRATHLLWQRRVAIKTTKAAQLNADLRGDVLASFVREGALLAELSELSAAVCQARDIGTVTTPDGTSIPYLVLEWLEGESLESICAREWAANAEPRTLAKVIRLLTPIAQALSLAHARGVVHRDVKPSNVMVVGDGADERSRCKLVDFGVAKVMGGIARDAAEVARTYTPAFAAPEQFEPSLGPTGPWTDVFALALVVVELVAGRAALQGDSPAILAAQACDPERRPTPRRLGVDISDQVEAVFERALEVDPLKRYADAGVFWKALEQAAATPEVDAASRRIPLRREPEGYRTPVRKSVTWLTVSLWLVAAVFSLLPSIER